MQLFNQLEGKIALYYLNAYNDAHISEQLCAYCNGTSVKKITSNRAQDFIHKYPQKHTLLGIAYTQYYWNGLYDYLFANVLSMLLPPQNKKHFSNKVWPLITRFKTEIALKKNYSEFATQHHLLFTLLLKMWWEIPFKKEIERTVSPAIIPTTRQYLQAMLITEKENIANNLHQKQELEKNIHRTTKQKTILEISKTFADPSSFLVGAKQTLTAASTWDILFIGLLKIRQLYS